MTNNFPHEVTPIHPQYVCLSPLVNDHSMPSSHKAEDKCVVVYSGAKVILLGALYNHSHIASLYYQFWPTNHFPKVLMLV
jgi:hypothetical protein